MKEQLLKKIHENKVGQALEKIPILKNKIVFLFSMTLIYIIIPAYEEENSIGKVIDDLKKHGYENIVVIDDGSTDSTFQIAKDKDISVIRHVVNRGQGAALETGIQYALTKDPDIVVTFDADGQFLAEDIKRLCEPIKNKRADVVLGSRFLGKAKNIPLIKKIVLKLGILVVYLLYDIKLTDSQNGFRAFSGYAASKIDIKSNGMEHAGEILHEIKSKKLKYMEVPVTVVYTDYSISKGQKSSKSIILGLKMILKKLMR
ncbi:glycosyltransferase [Candidatus Woesearchaeota archaeon]|nr:glycosyltransferase [Candidatus Woesearchaeota archaeon]